MEQKTSRSYISAKIGQNCTGALRLEGLMQSYPLFLIFLSRIFIPVFENMMTVFIFAPDASSALEQLLHVALF